MGIIGSTGVIRAALVGLATVAVLAASGPVHAGPIPTAVALEIAPPSANVTLDVVTVNGSGCPAGTASVAMLSDNTGFRIRYADFVARDGGSAGPTEFRQNCQVNVLVHVPQGFTFAVSRADYRGRMVLPTGATALHRTNYYHQGLTDDLVVDHAFAGPRTGAWHTTDIIPTMDLVYAPCGEDSSVNINTELRISSAGPAWMSLSSSSGEIDTILQFGWETCS